MPKFAVAAFVLFFLGGIAFQGYFKESETLGAAAAACLALGGALLGQHRKRKLSGFQLVLILYALSYAAVIPFAADTENAVVAAVQMLIVIPIAVFGNHMTQDSNTLVMKTIAWSGALLTVLGAGARFFPLQTALPDAKTTAVFLLAAGLCSIFVMLQEERTVYGLVLAVCIAGLCGTLSVSSWIVWGLAMALLALGKTVRGGREAGVLIAAHIGGFVAAMAISRNVLFFMPGINGIGTGLSKLHANLKEGYDAILALQQHPWGAIGGLPLMLTVGLFYLTVLSDRRQFHSPIRQGLPILVTVLLLRMGLDFGASHPLIFGLAIYMMNIYVSVETKPPRPIWEQERKSRQAAAAVPMIVLAVFAGYLAVAYGQKEAGLSLLSNSPNDAAAKLLVAGRMVPWSGSIPYETAKAYLAEGSRTGSKICYRDAENQLLLALQKSPREPSYMALLEQLKEKGEVEE